MSQFKGHTGPWPLTCALQYRSVRETERSSKSNAVMRINKALPDRVFGSRRTDTNNKKNN